ncbi:AzlC family ABC transporter permease [Nocardioides marmoribigeumensis]|uniref:Branched-subunit amino acid permease n=1 Tax=Nocardioides marmoribigeumensis TaxID=433649 RepID=A0ABU2BRR2_9ACTN|nr:AzlC family ABC transporter permease [Nocardioides marmoribigeumensis]MDR7361320.1 putative branched-subunit amino acid permease [Nocardioides marmoribigeumensis]
MTSAPPTPRAVAREGLTVGVAVGFYAVSFGAVAVAAGLSVLQTCAMSLLMFTGASQFAFVGVVASGGTPVSATVTATLLGARNGLYGLRLRPLLGLTGWRRVAAAHLVIDESTAMSVARPDRPTVRAGFLATGLGVFVSWNLFTLVGALAGNALGDPRDFGLDAAIGAAFLAMLWPRLHGTVHRVTALVAVAVALGLVPLAAPGVPVLLAGLVAVAVGAVARPGSVEPPGDEPVEGQA